MDIKVMEIVSSSYRIPIEDSVEMLQLMMAPKVDDQKQLFKSGEEEATPQMSAQHFTVIIKNLHNTDIAM